MKALLGHTTALECLRRISARGIALEPTEVSRIPAVAPSREVVDDTFFDLRDALGFDGPVDLLVAEAKGRRASAHAKCHVWVGAVSAGSFLSLNENACISSPEFVFLQMAGTLPMLELIQLGYELCGRYAINPQAVRGFDKRKAPLTDPMRLGAYLAHAKGCRGHAKAVRALRWILPNSWSPMETDVALLLCLPTRSGGYQFPLPELNRRVDLDADLATRLGAEWYYLDLSWKSGSIALEYNGEEDHAGTRRAGQDRTREMALAQLGVDLTVITSYQVFRSNDFDVLAKSLSQKLGRKFHGQSPAVRAKRAQLRSALFARLGRNALVG